MICKKCLKELTDDNIYPSDHRYCITCGTNHSTYLSERKQTLKSFPVFDSTAESNLHFQHIH